MNDAIIDKQSSINYGTLRRYNWSIPCSDAIFMRNPCDAA